MSAASSSLHGSVRKPRRFRVEGFGDLFDRNGIRAMVRGGTVGPETLVAREGKDDFRPASSFPELAALFRGAAAGSSQNPIVQRLENLSPRQHAFATIGAVLAMILGICSIGYSLRALTWPSVEGEVTRIVERSTRDSDGEWRKKRTIHYSYSVAGAGLRDSAREPRLLRYRRGDRITVRYDPDRPERSTLMKTPFDFAGEFAAIGAGTAVLLYELRRRRLARAT